MKPDPSKTLYPRARMDALTDGIYAVAMTLLVLDVRLPEDLHPADGAQLLQGFASLWPKVLPYVLSFVVLSFRWVAGLQTQSRAEYFSSSYVRWWLFGLFLVTCVPFTTIVVGRFVSFAPAIWLYAGNTALIAAASWRLLALTPDVENEKHLAGRRISLLVMLASALLCIGWSFVNPSQSLWILMLNMAAPALIRRSSTSSPAT